MYRLLCDATLLVVWDSLPNDASEQLTLALAAVCDNPDTADAYGIDDGIHRQIVQPLVTAIIAVNREAKTVRIYNIEHRR